MLKRASTKQKRHLCGTLRQEYLEAQEQYHRIGTQLRADSSNQQLRQRYEEAKQNYHDLGKSVIHCMD
jgi:hypothetical protein